MCPSLRSFMQQVWPKCHQSSASWTFQQSITKMYSHGMAVVCFQPGGKPISGDMEGIHWYPTRLTVQYGPLLFSLCICSLNEVISSYEFSIHCYVYSTILSLSYPPSDYMLLGSSWMTAHKLKTLVMRHPCQELVIFLDSLQISPSVTACNLVVTMDNQLSFSPHINKLYCLCKFLILNCQDVSGILSIEATGPFWTNAIRFWKLCLNNI